MRNPGIEAGTAVKFQLEQQKRQNWHILTMNWINLSLYYNHETYVNIQLFGAYKLRFTHPENKENRDIQLIGVGLYYLKFL